MLQRFRVAMVRSERERLTGTVEVDEALIGGVERGGVRGRGTTKEVVAIAVEVLDPKGFGRLRMRHIADASGANLVGFVCDIIATVTVNLRSGKIPITWHRVTRHFQNIEYRPGIEQKLFHFLWD
ncbi:MAG: hypothetical protein C3L25_06070 [Candidatus Sedimenticola endophacoides]|nr:MAG: hypothetical protein C3L26_06390 [Candidatus Sedimenticola endophacoides]PUE03937.1 MAG: hypothetical protein C3L25_06070 [Candidatus Sedimenticola endophacoides]